MRLIPLCVFSLAAAALVQPTVFSNASAQLMPTKIGASGCRVTSGDVSRVVGKPAPNLPRYPCGFKAMGGIIRVGTMTGAISVRGHRIDPKMYVAGICNDPGMRPIAGLGERACGGGPAVAVLHNGKATMVFMFVPSPSLAVAEKIARIEISK